MPRVTSRPPVAAPQSPAREERASETSTPARTPWASPTRTTDAFDTSGAPEPRLEARGGPVPQSELDAMRRSGQAELAATMALAQKSFAALLARGAALVVTQSEGNGGKPVVVLVPPSLAGNTDAARSYAVHVHYHGMGSTAAAPSVSSPLLERVEASFDAQPPTVFVLPHSASREIGTPQWSNVKDTGRTVQDALEGVTGQRGEVTVSAHSLGRRAIESAIANGGLVCDRLDVQDAFYRTQAEGPRAVKAWMDQHPGAKVRVLLTSDGMSDAGTLARQAGFPPGTIVVDRPFKGHWDAELKPW